MYWSEFITIAVAHRHEISGSVVSGFSGRADNLGFKPPSAGS